MGTCSDEQAAETEVDTLEHEQDAEVLAATRVRRPAARPLETLAGERQRRMTRSHL